MQAKSHQVGNDNERKRLQYNYYMGMSGRGERERLCEREKECELNNGRYDVRDI